MQSKLHAIARTFVTTLGDDLHRYTFVFPNHRAGLFFRKYITKYIQRPTFAPKVITINECFSELSNLQVTDQLTLLLRLYSEYQKFRPNESLERFIYRGKMMLSDFSEIDNHLIPHVDALFSSIQDWCIIEERFNYLTESQRIALSRFWKEFYNSDKNHPDSELHHQFVHTWDLLYPLYQALRDNLLKDGLAYEGMLHREVLEDWDNIPLTRFREQYVFVGFNALTTSERKLMLRLQEKGIADFYFDYDSPYLCDPQNKASFFMKENLLLFHSKFDVSEKKKEANIPNISLISVPSMGGEVHEVQRVLTSIISSQPQDLTRTVVVLPEEQLLIPLLNAFPASIDKINVTMGYPLRATSLYMPIAYPEQALQSIADTPKAFLTQLREYIISLRCKDNTEGVYQLCKVFDRLDAALRTYPQIAFTVADVQQLLKMLTLETTIPYVGEPLDGLQVMGVLETRALDFDNIIITGFNDDLYPGRTSANSFIPYVLRCGFDLPTPERKNAIFAYNFYRMLSYAKNVWLITNSTADEQNSGEVSRYYYQLKWQYNIDINEFTIVNQLISSKSVDSQPIPKDQRLQELASISSTALTTYLRCPKQFHYKYIERLKEPQQDETVSISDLTLGNVLHAIVEELYAPYLQKNITSSDLEYLLSKVNNDTEWYRLTALKDLQGDLLAERVVRTYVNNVLNYDYHHSPFQYIASEWKIKHSITLDCRKHLPLIIYGVIDRIDLQANTVRVIDYKTGRTDFVYTSMEDIFGVGKSTDKEIFLSRHKGKSQLLQTLLYCWMLRENSLLINSNVEDMLFSLTSKNPIEPHIYAVRRLSDIDSITYLHEKDSIEHMLFDGTLQQKFEKELMRLLNEIFNSDIPFSPTADIHICDNCPFVQLCKFG